MFLVTVVFWLVAFVGGVSGKDYYTGGFSKRQLEVYRDEVKGLFQFSLDKYLEKGYPYDEIRPISCVPRSRNFGDPYDVITNDVLGNFTTTLIDSLTSAAIMGDKSLFVKLTELVKATFPRKFDLDSTVQVFETTIRIVGGLISSHLYATDPKKVVYLGPDYDGFLLDLAQDMADRLLPAYLTLSGLPLSRINLSKKFHGFTPDFISENNVAAMASPLFEFRMLSYLTCDMKYTKLATYAFHKTWSKRSMIDLLPMSLNPQSDQIYAPITGIGASIDSFYESALKGAILFNDNKLYDIWTRAYEALNIYTKADWFYVTSHYVTSQIATLWVDSLSAFFPGLQILDGDIENATYKNLLPLKLWDNFGGIPERWQVQLDNEASRNYEDLRLKEAIPLEWYPLRPEFIESTYFLYRATKDPFYLNTGYHILQDLKTKFLQPCGLGGIQDLRTGEMQDRMESFVLSETLKYLYLLFDEANELHTSRGNYVFSTEAHPMWLSTEVRKNYKQNQYFNDTKYVNHYEKLLLNDRNDYNNIKTKKADTLLKRNLAELVTTFYDATEEKLNNQLKLKSELKDKIDQHELPKQIDVCPIINKFDQYYNQTDFMSSKLLTGFNKLFEIDYRYNDTIWKPLHQQNQTTIELASNFYKTWGGIKKGFSKLIPTSVTFDVMMDLGGIYQRAVQRNENLYCTSFEGKRKIRLETLTVGCVDSFGNFVDADFIAQFKSKNLISDKCNSDGTLNKVYIATELNGTPVHQNKKIFIGNHGNQKASPETMKKNHKDILELFGVNENNQLLLDCIPIINVYLN